MAVTRSTSPSSSRRSISSSRKSSSQSGGGGGGDGGGGNGETLPIHARTMAASGGWSLHSAAAASSQQSLARSVSIRSLTRPRRRRCHKRPHRVSFSSVPRSRGVLAHQRQQLRRMGHSCNASSPALITGLGGHCIASTVPALKCHQLQSLSIEGTHQRFITDVHGKVLLLLRCCCYCHCHCHCYC